MLSAQNLCAGYGSVAVLNGVGFTLKPGEILGLLGRNGVGKTTLLRTLIGLLRPRSGQITLKGQPIAGLPPHRIARRGLALVPQGRGILAKLTVRENLLLGTRALPQRSETIPPAVLEYFPILGQRLDQLGGTLSGGQQQMLAIGRALCGQPAVLLLDEPSEGIQPSIVQELGENIRKISRSSGMSVLLVEQNIDLALDLADRCMVMEKGSIVHEGSPEDFRDEATLRKYLAL
jgi:branched-chain amino acid transport system ATP-binding protein